MFQVLAARYAEWLHCIKPKEKPAIAGGPFPLKLFCANEEKLAPRASACKKIITIDELWSGIPPGPNHDHTMKKMLLLGLMLTASAFAQNPPPNKIDITAPSGVVMKNDLTTAAPAPSAAEVAAVAEVSNLKAQLQQAAQANQYLQAVAERNELAVRLMQVQQQLAEVQRDLTTARAEIDLLKAEAAAKVPKKDSPATKPQPTK